MQTRPMVFSPGLPVWLILARNGQRDNVIILTERESVWPRATGEQYYNTVGSGSQTGRGPVLTRYIMGTGETFWNLGGAWPTISSGWVTPTQGLTAFLGIVITLCKPCCHNWIPRTPFCVPAKGLEFVTMRGQAGNMLHVKDQIFVMGWECPSYLWDI